MKTTLHLALCLCCLCLLALTAPVLAAEDQAPAVETDSRAEAEAPDLFPVAPLLQTCTLQIECSDGSVISCMGNSSCQTSSNGRCTVCDGVQTDCCALTCCEQCDINYDNCIFGCDPEIPFTCNICERVYDRCVGQCTGGC